jgi:hypothetical protein
MSNQFVVQFSWNGSDYHYFPRTKTLLKVGPTGNLRSIKYINPKTGEFQSYIPQQIRRLINHVNADYFAMRNAEAKRNRFNNTQDEE